MARQWVVGFLMLSACTKASTAGRDTPEPITTPAPGIKAPAVVPAVAPPPVTPPPVTPVASATKVTVQMTSATLADDCGAKAPATPPPATPSTTPPKPTSPPAAEPKVATGPRKLERKADSDDSAVKMKAKRRCQQTSMQLSVISDASGTPTEIQIKKVELFDQNGVSLGELTPRLPTVWDSTGAYVPWDQKIAPAQNLSVSYMLSPPTWGPDRWNKTYRLKAVVTIVGSGGADQSVEKSVHVSAPATLPPNVKT